MNTLIIYDTKGLIITQRSGSDVKEPTGVPYLWVDIPVGKYVTSIDVSVTPNVAILADLPKSETQLLQDKLDLMQKALDELIITGGTI